MWQAALMAFNKIKQGQHQQDQQTSQALSQNPQQFHFNPRQTQLSFNPGSNQNFWSNL